MREYSALDLLRFNSFANLPENKKLSKTGLVSAYNAKYPELSSEQKLINLSMALKINSLHKAITGNDLPTAPKK